MKYILVAILSCLLLFSCVLRRNQFTKEEIFIENTPAGNYKKYAGQISSDTSHGLHFVQFDSIRVYMYKYNESFLQIFQSGLLSGQMIYCAQSVTCTPWKEHGWVRMNAQNDTLIPHFHGWTGYGFIIENMYEMTFSKYNKHSRYFNISLNSIYNPWSGNMIFLLELTNDYVDRNVNISTFIRDAKVTKIRYVGVKI